MSRVDWRIERVSRNISDWLGAPATDLLGRPLDSVLMAVAVHAIRRNLQIAVMGDTTARMFGIELVKGLICDLAVHFAGNNIVIECEPMIEEPSFNAAATLRGMMARLRQTDDDRSFYRVAARDMRALTGFDRVMIYRFDEDGSGGIIRSWHATASIYISDCTIRPPTSHSRPARFTNATGFVLFRTLMPRQSPSSHCWIGRDSRSTCR